MSSNVYGVVVAVGCVLIAPRDDLPAERSGPQVSPDQKATQQRNGRLCAVREYRLPGKEGEKERRRDPGVLAEKRCFASICYSTDGSEIGAVTPGRSAIVWDTRTGRVKDRLNAHGGWWYFLDITPSGGRIAASATSDGPVVWVFRRAGAKPVVIRPVPPGSKEHRWHDEVRHLAASPDGRVIASGGDGYYSRIMLWDAVTGRNLGSIGPEGEPVCALAYTLKGDRVVAGHYSTGTVRVWDPSARVEVRSLSQDPPGEGLNAFALSPDGRLLAAGFADGNIKIWETANWGQLKVINSGREDVFGVSFSPDSRRLAAVLSAGFVAVWDVAKGIRTHEGRAGNEERYDSSLRFSPNGRRIAVSTPDSIVEGSSGIPGGYLTRRLSKAPNSALPRFRTL